MMNEETREILKEIEKTGKYTDAQFKDISIWLDGLLSKEVKE